MEKFITFRELENGSLQYYILQRDFPHFVGIISSVPAKVFVDAIPIAGYDLWICFAYCLRGAVIPSYRNVVEEISVCMQNMATWFLQNRISKDEKKYSKFKMKVNDTTTG